MRWLRRPRADSGVTLIEVLVSMGLFALVGSLLLGLALSTDSVTASTRTRAGVTEETRTAMERLTRELRQSAGIEAVTLPGPTSPMALTFWTDFDGDGVRDTAAGDPEVLTYCWSPATLQLTLGATTDCDTARPVLAATVASVELELDSSEWAYDANGDGTTTWLELDQKGPPVGNQ
ncbi:MAG: prepilin-type N-terminal cleavage/methylation domain-containing protein, partial [Nocardioides sp.]|nr:prepilin-type N-terminal cleavage/methylation domain-containing protein [Nocardioides sp.]